MEIFGLFGQKPNIMTTVMVNRLLNMRIIMVNLHSCNQFEFSVKGAVTNPNDKKGRSERSGLL